MKKPVRVTFEEAQPEGSRIKFCRARIRFAPGPYGEIFTDYYTGQAGVEKVIEGLRSVFSEMEVEVLTAR